LFPGLRIGWLAADQEVTTPSGPSTLASELSKVKSLTTVNTSPLAQAVAGGVLLDGEFSLRSYTAAAVRFYAQNRARMLEALERHFGAGTELHGHVRWNRPQGGFFIVVRLPFVWTEDDVRACAQEQGLIVCPMSFFYLRSGGTREIRLSFSYISADMIDTAIERLSAFVRGAWLERRTQHG
jgi:(S)-3,5-dihydroxyphenylglycine transaminase